MADRYWIGGTGTWDNNSSSHWSSSSGGTGGASVPTAADDVFIDANSGGGVITIGTSVNGGAKCRSCDFTGYTGQLYSNGTNSPTLTIGDSTAGQGNVSLKMTSAMSSSISSPCKILFLSTSATQQTIDFAGILSGSPAAPIEIGDNSPLTSGNYLLTGSLVTGGTLDLLAGTFNSNGYAVTITKFASSVTASRSLTLGASVWTLVGTSIVWTLTTSNLSFDAGTSTIKLTSTSSATKTFAGAGLTYNTLDVSARDVIITGANTFKNIYINNAGLVEHLQLPASTTTTIASGGVITSNGTAGNLALLKSSSAGVQATISTDHDISLDYIDIKDIAVTGGGKLYCGTHSTNGGNNNANVVFTDPPSSGNRRRRAIITAGAI